MQALKCQCDLLRFCVELWHQTKKPWATGPPETEMKGVLGEVGDGRQEEGRGHSPRPEFSGSKRKVFKNYLCKFL